MIVAVTGTGTGIGKTHVACALLRAANDIEPQAGSSRPDPGVRAIGWKPVESGVTGERGEDEARLVEASGGIVAAPTIRLRAPLSPHLAARREGVALDAASLHETLAAICARWPAVVLELAGGLWSPFDDRLDNADWLAAIPPALDLRIIVVAPDRLGVLHDVSAVIRALLAFGSSGARSDAGRSLRLPVHAIALSAPEAPDASTGTNAAELRDRPALHGVPITCVPRAPIDVLSRDPGVRALAEAVLR
jgi:dethiobiotin synthetase